MRAIFSTTINCWVSCNWFLEQYGEQNLPYLCREHLELIQVEIFRKYFRGSSTIEATTEKIKILGEHNKSKKDKK
jgi:hypothetical protein